MVEANPAEQAVGNPKASGIANPMHPMHPMHVILIERESEMQGELRGIQVVEV